MAYLIFALVPVVMLLLLVMPRVEEWCMGGRPGPLVDSPPLAVAPLSAVPAPAAVPLTASAPAPREAAGLAVEATA
ncbi:MAG: hypothetical protein U0Q15_09700 [Kineosporiaceae bacterium]